MANTLDQLKATAKSREWHLLLHYERKDDGWISTADGNGFFFSEEGKVNPLKELVASQKAMGRDIKVGKLSSHPQCSFPARYRFLKKHNLLSETVKEVPCPDLDRWVAGIGGKEMSLIYASSYTDNPSSIFGHTFLKIRGEAKEKLWDYALNYAADSGEDGGFLFITKGVFGGYKGAFSLSPYFIKVNEYARMEGRDIWEYQLNLTKDEIQTVLYHLWELDNNTYFNYYFFDKNCSYYILTLLEVARPSLHLHDRFPFYVIPVETVKTAKDEKLIDHVQFRASLKSEYLLKKSELDFSQKEIFKSLIKGSRKAPTIFDPRVLDVAMLHFDHWRSYKKRDLSPEEAQILYKIASQRSQIPTPSSIPTQSNTPSNLVSPDLSHAVKSVTVSSGYEDEKKSFIRILPRMGVHDLMSNDNGYIPFSQLEFFKWDLRYYPSTKKVSFESFELLNIISLRVIDRFHWVPSWNVSFGYYNRGAFRGKVGGGATFDLNSEDQRLFFMLSGKVSRKEALFLIPEMGYLRNIAKHKLGLFFDYEKTIIGHAQDSMNMGWEWSYQVSTHLMGSFRVDYNSKKRSQVYVGGQKYF